MVGPGVTAVRTPVVELGEAILLPGLVNVHGHAELAMFRGELESLPFREWIVRLVGAKRAVLTEEDFLAAARWTAVATAAVTTNTMIDSVLEHLGLDASVAIGVGDSWNDVEMFQVCGTGIAMGNAAPELKALADETTTSVREDGVWNAFVVERLSTNKEEVA